ncbi:hypothetical protein EAO70_24110 [Streptomyces sp. adm13(2018)]|nr:hypothetical protein EAO70_24110 [Streptomyces sp. adm13(2018)]
MTPAAWGAVPKSEVEELVLEEVPDVDYEKIGGLGRGGGGGAGLEQAREGDDRGGRGGGGQPVARPGVGVCEVREVRSGGGLHARRLLRGGAEGFRHRATRHRGTEPSGSARPAAGGRRT